MLQHIYKIVIERKGNHGMGYVYFLTKVFKHFNIPLGVGKVGTVKQSFSESTIVECECIEGKGNHKNKVAQLNEDQDQLKHEVEEMTMRLSSKDEEIAILKVKLLKAQTEGSGTSVVQELKQVNADLKAKIVVLQEKVIKAMIMLMLDLLLSFSPFPISLPFIVHPIISLYVFCMAYLPSLLNPSLILMF